MTKTSRIHRSLLGLSLVLAAGCATDLDLDADADVELGEATSELSITDWSSPALVGADQQQAWLGGSMATLNGTTYMVHSGASSSSQTDLWWTQLTSSGWYNDIKIPGQLSSARPSLAAYNGSLYLFHTGSSSGSTDIWVSRFNPWTAQWSTNFKLGFTSKGVPAIAAFNGLLYIVGVTPSNNNLFMATMNTGEAFSVPTAMAGHYSASAVSLAVYNNRLYMAHRAGSTATIVYNSFNGASWGWDLTIEGGAGPLAGYEPAIAAYNGYLHLVHLRPGSTAVYWTYFDGTGWPAEVTIGNRFSTTSPKIIQGGAGLVLLTTSDYYPSSASALSRYLYTSQYQTPPIGFDPGGVML